MAKLLLSLKNQAQVDGCPRPQGTPVTGALIFHRVAHNLHLTGSLASGLTSTPRSLHPSPTGPTAILGCARLSLVQPFAHAVPLGEETVPPVPHLVSIYCPSQLSLGTPSSKKPPLIHAPQGATSGLPLFQTTLSRIINNLSCSSTDQSVSPLDSETRGSRYVSCSTLILSIQHLMCLPCEMRESLRLEPESHNSQHPSA